jgi:folate-dependent phosphoribosylglycinamide formyltransferase PurN
MLTGPLRIAVLSSRRAPGLSHLLDDAEACGLYRVVCGLTTEEDFEHAELYEAAGVPLLSHPIRAFYKARGRRLTDLAVRPEFDAETAALLSPYQADAVLLSSYLYILTFPFLSAFPGRIVNVHGSDTTRRGADGKPLYPGLRAVRDAIVAGEPETRATAHVVTEALDEGPPLLTSAPYPVASFVAELSSLGKTRAVHAYAHAHQEWMLETAWGPLLSGSARLLGEARAWLLETEPPPLLEAWA